MKSVKQKLLEMLAEQAHISWSGWIHHQLESKGIKNEDDSVTIPAEYVERWTRQMKTSYNQLSEEEKDSDRAEATFYITVIEKWLEMIGSK